MRSSTIYRHDREPRDFDRARELYAAATEALLGGYYHHATALFYLASDFAITPAGRDTLIDLARTAALKQFEATEGGV